MSINTQLHRYTGAANGWENVYPRTIIDNVLDKDDPNSKFLFNGKIRSTRLDFAEDGNYALDAGKEKVVNGKLLANVVEGLKNSIEGKKNTYVSTKISDWTMSDGTPATESSLSGNEAIITSVSTSDGLKDSTNLHIGDVILRTNVDVSDWWVGNINTATATVTVYPLETRKLDLSPYAKKDGETFVNVKSINTYSIGKVISRGYETEITNTDDNVPTSKAVKTYVSTQGFITNEVDDLTNYYTSGSMDDKLEAIDTRIKNINNTVGEIKDNYAQSTAIDAQNTGFNFPYWNEQGVINGHVPVYEKQLKVGNDNQAVKIIATNNYGATIPLADNQSDGVMSKNMYKTFSNFFRGTITEDCPKENVNVGDLCITLV